MNAPRRTLASAVATPNIETDGRPSAPLACAVADALADDEDALETASMLTGAGVPLMTGYAVTVTMLVTVAAGASTGELETEELTDEEELADEETTEELCAVEW